MSKIIVDADACPMKSEILRLGKQYQLEVTFVASYAHFSIHTSSEENWIYVDTGKESADMRIVNLAQKGDYCFTQDIGLASILLAKGVFVFSNRGEAYSEEEMPMMLDIRYQRAKERRQGKYAKGPKAIEEQDRTLFFEQLVSWFDQKEGKR